MNTTMEQERKFPIADFIATIQEDGTIQIPPQLLEVLGVQPGQSIHFIVDDKGKITVQAYYPTKKNTEASTSPDPITEDATQATLFDV
jgi:bifunctional DNA-binding transcriptional regulator/antitoxin component of YhaV-PrlF toxin-antitoxin module